MENQTERLLDDPLWNLRWLYYKKTGSCPIEFGEFHPAEMTAFFVGIDQKFDKEDNSTGLSSWPRVLKAPSKWEEAVETGDDLIDKWEREIAAGLDPDLSEGAK